MEWQSKYWLAMIAAAGLVGLVFANPGKHRGHPSPSPTPTATPTPTPTATPTPTPTPPSVTLAWDASTGATGYHLWMGFASGQEGSAIDVGNNLIWTIQLSPSTTYYFYVTAYNPVGDSLPSNEVSYVTP